ncbi:MAG: hypothetical protein AB1457_14125 [Chloroflexota bacterium]
MSILKGASGEQCSCHIPRKRGSFPPATTAVRISPKWWCVPSKANGLMALALYDATLYLLAWAGAEMVYLLGRVVR